MKHPNKGDTVMVYGKLTKKGKPDKRFKPQRKGYGDDWQVDEVNKAGNTVTLTLSQNGKTAEFVMTEFVMTPSPNKQ